MFFKLRKMYNDLRKDYTELKLSYDKMVLDNIDKDLMLRVLRSRKAGLELIDDSIKNCSNKEDIKKLELLKRITSSDASYSNYTVKTGLGRICVDASQIPWTSEEMKSMLGMKEGE